MSKPDPHQLRSSQPVNLRTARKQGLQQPTQLSAVEQQRVAALKHRHQTLVSGNLPSQQKTVSKTMLVAGAALLTSGGAFGIAVIIGSGALALLASAGIGLSGFLFARLNQRKQADQDDAFGLNSNQLRTLDNLIIKVSDQSDEEVQAMLVRIQQQLDSMIQMLERDHAVDAFTFEQRFYVQQFVERYLPDSLRAYLQVPASARQDLIMLQDKTPLMLLKSQLALLQQGLSEHETKLHENAAEQLLQQQRFLESKNSEAS